MKPSNKKGANRYIFTVYNRKPAMNLGMMVKGHVSLRQCDIYTVAASGGWVPLDDGGQCRTPGKESFNFVDSTQVW